MSKRELHRLIQREHGKDKTVALLVPLDSPSPIPPGIYEKIDGQWTKTDRKGAFGWRTIKALRASGKMPC